MNKTMKYINCKYSMTPKQADIGLNFICTNSKQIKGFVKASYECKIGEKR